MRNLILKNEDEQEEEPKTPKISDKIESVLLDARRVVYI